MCFMALVPPRDAMASTTAYSAVVSATRLVNVLPLSSSSSSCLGSSTSAIRSAPPTNRRQKQVSAFFLELRLRSEAHDDRIFVLRTSLKQSVSFLLSNLRMFDSPRVREWPVCPFLSTTIL